MLHIGELCCCLMSLLAKRHLFFWCYCIEGRQLCTEMLGESLSNYWLSGEFRPQAVLAGQENMASSCPLHNHVLSCGVCVVYCRGHILVVNFFCGA